MALLYYIFNLHHYMDIMAKTQSLIPHDNKILYLHRIYSLPLLPIIRIEAEPES